MSGETKENTLPAIWYFRSSVNAEDFPAGQRPCAGHPSSTLPAAIFRLLGVFLRFKTLLDEVYFQRA